MKLSKLLAGLFVTAFALQGFAQTFPSKPVSMIIAFAAGGPSDVNGRIIGKAMAESLGQSIVVDNVPGVGGALGVVKLANATPDGHTIIAGSPLELILTPLGISAAKNKPEDVRMIALAGHTTMALVTRKDLGVNSVEELVALMKRPGSQPLLFASTGVGSLYHLMAEKFLQSAGVKGLHVPYSGGGIAPALTDLIGGRVDFMFAPMAGPIPGHMNNGNLKPLAVSSADKHTAFPALRTMKSIKGFEDFVFTIWIGIQTGAKVSNAAAAVLHKAAYAGLANPETKKSLEASGTQVAAPMTLAEAEAFYKREVVAYQALARTVKIDPQ